MRIPAVLLALPLPPSLKLRRTSRCLSAVLLALPLLAACADISPQVGPVKATVNIGTAKPPVAEVTTLIERCAPPPGLLAPWPPLPPIAAKRLDPKALLGIALDDAKAYNIRRFDHAALTAWLGVHCNGTTVAPAPSSPDTAAPARGAIY